jgi:predicted HTH domain antitoxin
VDTRWRIELFGRLRAARDDRVITRFRTQKTGALLAHLAYYRDRLHPREVLIEVCLRLGGALWRFWYMRSHLSEGREWLKKAVTSDQLSVTSESPTLAKALEAAGILAFYQNDCVASRPLLTDSLALWRQLDDARGMAQSLHFLGNVTNEGGDPVAARAFYEESQAHWRKSRDELGIAYSLMMMAQAVSKLDGRAAAYPHRVEAAIEMFKAGEVSLSRAAEIAGMSRWRFQDQLAQRGIPIVIEADEADARAQSQRIRDKYL